MDYRIACFDLFRHSLWPGMDYAKVALTWAGAEKPANNGRCV
jgi:hypothetical protein